MHLWPQLKGQHLKPLEQLAFELQVFLELLQIARTYCKFCIRDAIDGQLPTSA
jgi:hypothetical protein